MSKKSGGLKSKNSAEAAAGYEAAKSATAANASGNESPTIGKSIPIITGGARPKGDVIWCQTRRDKNNECRGDIAVCFGRNAFSRPLGLSIVSVDGAEIYSRKNGATIDPPGPVRFYDGTQTTADPLIVSVEGASNTPAFTGYIYAVLENVLLKDGNAEISAEFTDAASSSPTITYQSGCDSDLAGVNLVKDFETGWYYGIKGPMTTNCYFIRSQDGCTIFDKRKLYVNPAETPFYLYYDNILPVRCSNMILVLGYYCGDFSGPKYCFPGFQLIADPSTSDIYYNSDGLKLTDASLPYNYSPTYDLASSPYTEYFESYPLPGSATQFVFLRKFDRSNTNWNVSNAYTGYLHPTSGGNVCGTIIDIKRNYDIRDWTGSGSSTDTLNDEVIDIMPPGTQIGASLFANANWILYGFPQIDKAIYCKSESTQVLLAGAVQSGNDIIVYRIYHSVDGIAISSTVTLHDAIQKLTFGGIEYDAGSDLVLVSAQPGANPSTSSSESRIYQITAGGSYAYTETGAPRIHIADRKIARSVDGATVLTNSDSSLILSYDAATTNKTTLYSGTAPSGSPIIDMSRNTISLPTVTGRTTYVVNQVVAGDIPLSDLITDICALKGYAPADLVFEGFSGLVVRGMTISSTTRINDLLNRIGQIFGFVFAETDGKLKFRRRRSSSGTITPDITLVDDDLIEGPENLTVQRQAATTVLGSLSLTWLDPDREFESNNVMARRITGVLSGEAGARDEEISLPLAIDQATARQMLFQSFYAQAEGETRVSFSVGPKNIRIEPGDVIALNANGSNRIVQARRVTHRADLNILDIEADSFMSQATPTIGSAGGNTVTTAAPLVSGSYMHLDIPLITAADYPGAGYTRQYHGLTTFDSEFWGGADFYKSGDGVTYSKVLDYDVQPMAIGIAQNALGECLQNYAIDTASQLIIKVEGGNPADFVSVTELEQASDVTLCAYGRPGRWELLSFQNAVHNIDGTITLSNLQRGMYGTSKLYFNDVEGGLNLTHEAGDYVCLFGTAIRSSVRPAADYFKLEAYAVATADLDVQAAPKVWKKVEATTWRAPPVANVLASHTAGSANLVITWDEVSPIPHQWADNGSTATMPETYDYDVYIEGYDSFSISTTVTGTNTWTWTGYGTQYGATSKAPQQIKFVTVTPSSPTMGNYFFTVSYDIREI